jgi:transcriptional regulator with XRE-family HTH domain
MRQERGWSQAYLAELLGTSQNAVYRLENPQYGKPSITTLKRLASIFDVGLSVWFSPFSKLVDRVTNLSTDDILVPSFENDPGFHEREAALGEVQTTTIKANLLSLAGTLQTIDQSQIINRSADQSAVGGIGNLSGRSSIIPPEQEPFFIDPRPITLDSTPTQSIGTLKANYTGELKYAKTG